MQLISGIYSNIIAGVMAAAIYLIIALTTGVAAGPAIWIAVLLGGATFVIAFIITKTITHARGRRVASSK